jgi:peptide/nickel transport system substrate-binding protein
MLGRRTALAGLGALPLAHGAVAQGRRGTLTIAQNFDPISLWPNATTASDNINAGAVIVQPLFWGNPATGAPEPLLATGFTAVAPTEIRITLRPGVRFTNGEPMDADAVVFSLNLFRDAAQTPAYAIYAAAFDGVEKIDAATVLLRTKYPSPTIGIALTQVYIVPPEYLRRVGLAGFGQKPVGTGPFKLAEWVKDSRLVMDRNPDYWGASPSGIDRVIWRAVPDDTARAAGLQAGELDITSALAISDVTALESDANVKLVDVPSFRIYGVTLSSLAASPSPLQDRRVRQALNYAVDKTSLIKNVLFGRARALSGQMLRREQMGFDPGLTDYPYDPDRARTLLAEAGYPNGFEIGFKSPSGRFAQDREVSEAVAGMLAKVGVRARMTLLEPGEFLRQLRNRELGPMAFAGLAPPDDPDFQVSQYRSTWRYSYVQNPQFDALIDAGAQTLDPKQRAETYRKLMVLMREEAPIIFLYQGVDYYGTSPRVKGFRPTGDGRIHLYGVSLG